MRKQEQQTALTQGRAENIRWHLCKDGSRFFASGIMTPLQDKQGHMQGLAKIMRDVTNRHLAAQQRRTLEREATLLTERNRIAQDLHRHLSPAALTAIKLQLLDAAEDALPPAATKAHGYLLPGG